MARVEDVDTGEKVTVNVGDWVSFKCDIEQSAQIIAINGNRLTVEAPAGGFSGEYICRDDTTVLYAEDCWVE